MSQQRHIIGRTILELNTNNLADVWSLQEDVSQVFQQQAVPEIERLFDRLVEPDEIVRFDRVVVDVGAIDPHNLPDEFPRQVVAELDRILSDRLTTLKLQRQLTGSVPTSGDPEISIQDRTTADWEVLLYFLQYGRLPWWCPARDWQGWLTRWEAALQHNRAWRQPMQVLFATNLNARQRFVFQLPEGFRQQCLLQLQPTWTDWPSLFAQARRLIQALHLSPREMRSLETQAWLLLLAEIRPDSTVGRPLPTANWARTWLTALVKTCQLEAAIASEFPTRSIAPDAPSQTDSQASFSQRVEQRLRAALETFSAAERAVWLEAIQNRPTADWEVLLSFLQYGRLPWWCPAGDWQSWFPRWEAALQRNTAWRQPMQILLATNPAARQRFVSQLPEGFRQQCLLQLQPAWIEWSSRLTQARRLMQSLGLSQRARYWLDTQAWVLLLAEIQPGSPVGSPLPAETWARNWMAQLVQTWRSQLNTSETASPPIRSAPRQESSLIQEPIQSPEPGSPSTPDSSPTPPTAQISFEYMVARLRAVIKTFSSSEQNLWLAAISTTVASQKSQPPIPTSQLSPDSVPAPAKTPIAESIESEAEVRRPPEDSPAQDTNALDSSSSDDLQEEAIEFRDSLKAASAQNSTEQTTNASDLSPASDLQEEAMEPSVFNEAVDSVDDSVAPDRISSESVSVSSGDMQDGVSSSPKQTDTSELPPELIAFLKGDKTQPIPTAKASRSSLSSEEERGGIYITQAGLVLLHPFIQPYLDEVGLLNEALFRDDTAQQQAIYLLHYLATGQTRAPEPELVLPKLLCGWPLNDPVEPDLELPEAALVEGEHLLQTAIGYWEALKSTSPDGLREGFLQREGKLTCTDNGWKLQVERQAIDILLSRLPWGVSMVKLPWMEDLLTVEWT